MFRSRGSPLTETRELPAVGGLETSLDLRLRSSQLMVLPTSRDEPSIFGFVAVNEAADPLFFPVQTHTG